MTVFLELGDYCEIAAELLGTSPGQIARLPNIGLADSALAAPRAGFGGQDAYPTLLEKGAILVERLARNHPLPDVPLIERVAAGEATQEEILDWLAIRTEPASSVEAP